MFAEELGGNASRKRAEEAKARRKRLKEKQQQQAAAEAQKKSTVATSSTISSSSSGVISSPSATAGAGPSTSWSATSPLTGAVAVTPVLSQPSTVSRGTTLLTSKTTTSSSSSSGKPQLSAVERAAEQRQIRATAAAQKQAAVRLQAALRGKLTRTRLRRAARARLESKLGDLATIRTILQKKQTASSSYIPPVTTAVPLLGDFVFALRPNSGYNYKEDVVPLFHQILDLVILPGLQQAEDPSRNPVVSWCFLNENQEDPIRQKQGLYRLKQLLRLLLEYSNSKNVACAEAVVQCLRSLLLGTTPAPSLNLLCREQCLFKQQKHFDLIETLRHNLLFFRDKPIPTDAEEKRDACFSANDKNRVGALFQLTVEVIMMPQQNDENSIDQQQRQTVQARFVKDILSVPLLTWRLPAPTLSFMVSTSGISSPLPLLVLLLGSFMRESATSLNDGVIEGLLESDDLPMTLCGATGTQRFLANLLQFGRLIPACSGTVITEDDFAVATTYFRLVAALVHVVPIGTFITSRESSIAWVSTSDGRNQKAIVLSPIILEQCKALLVDGYVRRLFQSSIDTVALDTEGTLAAKNEKDLKLEKAFQETKQASAASLAAKQVRVDRSKGFWNSSKWAKKLSKGVTDLLSTNATEPKKASGKIKTKDDGSSPEQLKNTTSLSRQLALEGAKNGESLRQERRNYYSTNLLLALVRTYAIVLARWGGGGNDDMVSGQKNVLPRRDGPTIEATSVQEGCISSLLNVLCFSTSFVRAAWGLIQSEEAIFSDVYKIIDADKGKVALRSLSIQPFFDPDDNSTRRTNSTKQGCDHDGAALLYAFFCAFSHVLIVTDDVEIHGMDKPIPIHQMRRGIQVLKKLLYRAVFVDRGLVPSSSDALSSLSSSTAPNYFGLALIAAASRTMKDLYDRSSRRPICEPSLFVVSGLLEKELGRCKSYNDYQTLLKTSPVLRVCPYMVSFKRRLKLFDRIITTNRIEIQGENSSNPFHTNPLKPGIPVRITRGRILEDGLATMNKLGRELRQRIAVHYYNEVGTRETGIDAGGLFKEFWTDLCAIAFDPNYALFKVTESGPDTAASDFGNCLYPNPSSGAAHGSDHITLFAFLGRILGKALYEGITIHPRFAHFFLSFLKGQYNYLNMVPDLGTIDPQLYSNLMFLKNYDGDASDLSLTFTVTIDDFGGTREIPLIPNGANVDVTNANKQRYIGLVAKYYVYDRLREQSEAMTRGLFEVVDRSWLRLFNEPELQVLISGASDGKLDVEDLKANCHYVGGFSGLDRTIGRFWNVVESLNEKQQAELLRFVTSCERPPPLGFGSLNPPFTIQRVGILRDGDRLPTASTCFNILKLPTYSSEKVLKQRLLYAIEAGAGFELT